MARAAAAAAASPRLRPEEQPQRIQRFWDKVAKKPLRSTPLVTVRKHSRCYPPGGKKKGLTGWVTVDGWTSLALELPRAREQGRVLELYEHYQIHPSTASVKMREYEKSATFKAKPVPGRPSVCTSPEFQAQLAQANKDNLGATPGLLSLQMPPAGPTYNKQPVQHPSWHTIKKAKDPRLGWKCGVGVKPRPVVSSAAHAAARVDCAEHIRARSTG